MYLKVESVEIVESTAYVLCMYILCNMYKQFILSSATIFQFFFDQFIKTLKFSLKFELFEFSSDVVQGAEPDLSPSTVVEFSNVKNYSNE